MPLLLCCLVFLPRIVLFHLLCKFHFIVQIPPAFCADSALLCKFRPLFVQIPLYCAFCFLCSAISLEKIHTVEKCSFVFGFLLDILFALLSVPPIFSFLLCTQASFCIHQRLILNTYRTESVTFAGRHTHTQRLSHRLDNQKPKKWQKKTGKNKRYCPVLE